MFYSGRAAFSGTCPLYILGLNPGGDRALQERETVEWHTRKVLAEKPAKWSEYSDESWGGYPAGRRGMQPRITHLLGRLGLQPGEVPASNVIFLRSRRERTLSGRREQLAEMVEGRRGAGPIVAEARSRVLLVLAPRLLAELVGVELERRT